MDWIKVEGGFEDENGNFITEAEAEVLEVQMLEEQDY